MKYEIRTVNVEGKEIKIDFLTCMVPVLELQVATINDKTQYNFVVDNLDYYTIETSERGKTSPNEEIRIVETLVAFARACYPKGNEEYGVSNGVIVRKYNAFSGDKINFSTLESIVRKTDQILES